MNPPPIMLALIASVSVFLGACAEDHASKKAIVYHPPQLTGLDKQKPSSITLKVQAAYNSNKVFIKISWPDTPNKLHEYWHFDGNQWLAEGGHRRDAQATLDNDNKRGRVDVRSTIYESNVAIVFNEPDDYQSVNGFQQFGCFLACHDDNNYMPEWNSNTANRMYIEESHGGQLDLWQQRIARGGPIGWAEDAILTTASTLDTYRGGRHFDNGDAAYAENQLSGDHPQFVFDPGSTIGFFAQEFSHLLDAQFPFFVAPGSLNGIQQESTLARTLRFNSANDIGYVAQNNDAVPRYYSQTPSYSRADVSSLGSYFEPNTFGLGKGEAHVLFQRDLNTHSNSQGYNQDDIQFNTQTVYNIAFAVSTDKVAGRDHYVSLPLSFSLGSAQIADIQAVNDEISYFLYMPNFTDKNKYPVTEVKLFLPGITSYEFLMNDNRNKQYFNPQTNSFVDQTHEGTQAMLQNNFSCFDCHTISEDEVFDIATRRGEFAGALETLTLQRGGVFGPTPMP
ncbi:MAG: ethylbenzene dehydrogenase-related protein [Gammaproteobacteria bacterium]|nr:ethylbenzene dehydrogenase-related protein [Gammaproteobacteria bacterium]MDH5728448.1 ethylbenzene dehydrogenase-related protein [Gammaproteobacteria bacterium]